MVRIALTGRPNRLTVLRRHEGLTLKALAAEIEEETGISCAESTLSRWETGSRPIPDQVKLFLSGRFEISVAYLMNWPEANANGEENGNGDNGHDGDLEVAS
jgi:transcriptional regulator with XRE-family HTH domain